MTPRTLLLALTAFVGGGLLVFFWPRLMPSATSAGKTSPELGTLRQQLEQVAEKSMPLPTLGGWSIRLDVPASALDARIGALQHLAVSLGGTARRGLDRESATVLLVTLPPGSVPIFQQNAVLWPPAAPLPSLPAGDSSEFLDGEVILQPRTP